MEPLLLKPHFKSTMWGGERLIKEFNKDTTISPLAETWECSAHPHGPSRIANGEFAGKTLDVVLKEHPEYLGSRVPKGETLPIMIKFIDADKDLSIQVHPSDEYALARENSKGKTEMWYVLDAKPGASLVHGFSHEMSLEFLKKAIAEGHLEQHLQRVEVHKNDVFFTPAGIVHGIGAGCLIAEIMENSDLTYRLYDYDRVDVNGQKRELHYEKAMQVIDLKIEDKVKQVPKLVRYYPGCSREILCRCQFFETERVRVTKEMSFSVMATSFQVILCIDGQGELSYPKTEQKLQFKKGECIFLPADLGRCSVDGNCEFLKVRV